jgi:phosphatidate cytidylyltransferase
MITVELKKRLITSLFLISLLILMFFYSYILISALIVVAIIAWVEFNLLIYKIFNKKKLKDKIWRFFYKTISLIFFLSVAILIILIESLKPELRFFIFFSLSISISSDIGGLVFGKLFKGKKLTKISPNKTISGALGSFIFSLLLVPLIEFFIVIPDINNLVLIILLVSLTSQIGDLSISFLKRKAKVKDTSNLLPGHGGVLDRIDGIVFAIPVGLILFNLLK